MSNALLWELTKNYNCFLKSDKFVTFSADPLNLTNVHSAKFSGLSNAKAVGVQAVTKGKFTNVAVISKKTKASAASQPSASNNTTVVKTLTFNKKTGNKAAKAIESVTKGYRSDLTKFAVARYHAIRRSILAASRK